MRQPDARRARQSSIIRGGETPAAAAGSSEDYTARFDLLVNLQSMLIERIEGEQRLPDGAEYRTTLDITPILAEQPEPANQPQSTD